MTGGQCRYYLLVFISANIRRVDEHQALLFQRRKKGLEPLIGILSVDLNPAIIAELLQQGLMVLGMQFRQHQSILLSQQCLNDGR